jgi:hypothetical protein
MRKILFLFVALFAVFTVSACEEVIEDASKVLLQDAKDSLNGVIGDPSNITATFQVPVNLMNDVTAVWSSSNPGVITFAAPVSGLATATVNRPAFGEPDAVVTLTAVLMIESSLDATKFLSDEFVIQVTVKANTVEEIVIETVADMLAIRDLAYDRTIEVVIKDLTVIAMGNDGAFAYDGTGITQLYGSNLASIQVGKVYTVTGTPDWYFGLWELVNWTAAEQVGATPKYPTQQIETDVSQFIADLIADDAHTFAPQNAEAGAFEPIAAKVTGIVYLVPGDTGNYNTYILDTEFVVGTDTFNLGAAGQPAGGLLVYYNTQDFAKLRLYNGITVTIDVIVHTYRSNNNAFALYYVGGPEGIVATLSEAQKLSFDAAAIEIPTTVLEATTLNLSKVGSNGAVISWTSSNQDIVDPLTGAVTIPETAKVVTLEATVVVGELTPVKRTFTVVVGPLESTPLNQIGTLSLAQIGYSEAVVVWKNANNRFYVVGDATGYAYIFNAVVLDLNVGDFVGLTYEIGAFRGLNQMTKVIVSTPKAAQPTPPAATVWTATEALAYATSTSITVQYVTFENLVGFASGNFTNAYLPGFGMRNIQTNGAANTLRDAQFSVTGFMIGRSSDAPANAITIQGVTYSEGTALTDATKLAIAKERLVVPASSAEVTGDITLPTTGLFGSTVVWTSSNEAVIAKDGTVTRPLANESNADVQLSYIISAGTLSSDAVTINFTVLKLTNEAEVTSIYTLGFEEEDGFTSSNVYNNAAPKQDGLENFKWESIMGTSTTTGKINGTLSFQFRTYTTPDLLGYIKSLFDLEDVTSFKFNAKALAGTVMQVSISKDGGLTWISPKEYTLTTASVEYEYVIAEEDLDGNFRIKIEVLTKSGRTDLVIDDLIVYGLR